MARSTRSWVWCAPAVDVSGPPLVNLDAPAVVEQGGDVGQTDGVGRVEAVGLGLVGARNVAHRR
jgi:hypothetical protein